MSDNINIWKNIIDEKEAYIVIFINSKTADIEKAKEEINKISDKKLCGLEYGMNAVILVEEENNQNNILFTKKEYNLIRKMITSFIEQDYIDYMETLKGSGFSTKETQLKRAWRIK